MEHKARCKKSSHEEPSWEASFYRHLMEASPGLFLHTDCRGIIIEANRTAEEMTGFQREALIGTDFARYFSKAAKAREALRRAFIEGAAGSCELEVLHINGHETPVLCDVTVYGKSEGSPGSLFLMGTNIAMLKGRERALLTSAEMFRTIADFTYDFETMSDPEGSYLYLSPSCERITGYDVADFNERPELLIEVIHPDDRKRYLDHLNLELREYSKIHNIDFRVVRKDGSVVWLSHYCQPMFSRSGILMGRRASNRDITARKQAEQALLKARSSLEERVRDRTRDIKRANEALRSLSSRLEAAREEERKLIAREVHDELGQVLTALKFDVAWLGSRLKGADAIYSDKIEGMQGMILSAIDTVKRITTLLRPQILDVLGMVAAIEWLAEDFQKRTSIGCRLKVSPGMIIPGKDLSVAIFRICQEALTNVARHSGASEVTIALKKTREFLTLVIEDDGRGIKRKEISGSSSLGIIGARERVASMGGTFHIEGKSGQGTKIRIRIPYLKEGEKNA
ncbi:MAG: PAS domain S-box protein [Candidatus Eremiobacteraeota bacterium]|nr:PAS domain S-box protein [Candidatus Eremiobacteraeota bacterium]